MAHNDTLAVYGSFFIFSSIIDSEQPFSIPQRADEQSAWADRFYTLALTESLGNTLATGAFIIDSG
jgi:hypothetical protein